MTPPSQRVVSGSRRHRMPPVMLGLLLVAFGLRVVLLDASSFWLDELIQTKLAATPLRHFLREIFLHANMPLDILLTKALLKLGGQDAWLRLPAALAGTLSVAVIYRLARDRLEDPTPWLAALLLALSPLALTYSREVRPYSLMLLVTLSAVFFFLRSLDRPGYWPLCVLCMVIAAHTHLFALALLPVFALYLLGLQLFNRSRQPWRRTTLGLVWIGLAAVVTVLSPATPNYIGRVLNSLLPGAARQMAATPVEIAEAFRFPSLGFLLQQLPFDFGGLWPGGWLAIVLAVLGIHRLRRQPALLSFLLLWLGSGAIVLFTLARRDHWYSARYLLFVLPALLLLAASGIAALMQSVASSQRFRDARGIGQALPYAVPTLVVLSLLPGIAAALKPEHENWRAAGAFVRQVYTPETLVVAPMAARYLDHYARGIPMVDAQSGAEVEALGQQYKRVLVLQSAFSPLQAPEDQWINPAALIAHIEPGIDVYEAPAGDTAAARLAERQIDLAADETDPQQRAARLWEMGKAGRESGQWPLAAAALAELTQLTPDSPDVWTELGFARQMQQDYASAGEAYRQALAINPEQSWALLLLANTLRVQGRFDEALTEAVKATDIAPRLPQAWDALGHTQLALGQNREALDSFDRGLALLDEDVSLTYGRARALTALGDERAQDAWAALLQLRAPGNLIQEGCVHVPDHAACRGQH